MQRVYWSFWGVLVLAALFMAQSAWGQFIIIPEHRIAPIVPIHRVCAIRSISVDATIREQVAEVQLAQVVRNYSAQPMEASFVFPIPGDAAISQFTLLIDGREVPAKMYTKEEARRIYEGIVRAKRDPALLEYIGYGMLQTQVFPVPANGERKITLRYTQVCKRERDITEFAFPMAAGKLSSRPVEELRFTARIESAGKIKSVYSPSYPVNVERTSENSATVKLTMSGAVPSDDLRLIWGLSDQPIGATLLSYRPGDGEDGYFLLLASPEVRSEAKRASKTVIFTLDRSGSMAGPKIEQARNALKFVMNNLREGDTFNIVVFDDRVESFAPELQRFNDETRAKALRYIEGINDGGSTNIDGALRRSFELAGNTGRPTYVIFLTDGLPTTGERNESAIAEHARQWNHNQARLFTFGLGFDVNARLLDRLSTENSGTTEYVKPNEDIERAVAKFYGKMTAPVLTRASVELTGAEMNRVYPRELPDLFAGQQVVAVGRYRNAGEATIRLAGRVGDEEHTYTYPATLASARGDDTNAFIEKLWATRRVGEILNELDLHGKNQELIDELVRLSTRHGILTPYTAFLANENTNLHAMRENSAQAEYYAFKSPQALENNQTGSAGVNLRQGKQDLQRRNYTQQGQGSFANAQGRMQVEENCQVVGNQALFRRNNRWIDPSVTAADEAKAENVEQFSERYFELARNNRQLRQYLALPEGCTVRVQGQVYRITAQQANGG
jgi:Ca-activated chloride channel family protein